MASPQALSGPSRDAWDVSPAVVKVPRLAPRLQGVWTPGAAAPGVRAAAPPSKDGPSLLPQAAPDL